MALFTVERSELRLEDVAEAFRAIVASEPEALVVDLRRNNGGNFSSGFLAAHLVDAPATGGVLLQEKAFEPLDILFRM